MSLVDSLNSRYFSGDLSPAVVDLLRPIDAERLEVRTFVERLCRQLHRQRLPARDFSEGLAWLLRDLLPKLLPGAWGGLIPPVTQQGRHARVDEYLASNPWRPLRDGDRLLDIGCGFPPVTTVDTGKRFPGVHVLGADPSFGKHLVRDAEGDYAVFAEDGSLLYFQVGSRDPERMAHLYADPELTRARFCAHLAALRDRLPDDDGHPSSVIAGGIAVIQNPIREYERENASFAQLSIGDPGLTGYAAVRCFNVLMYYDDGFRQEALAWLGSVLEEGGVLVAGANGPRSRLARYTVYQNEAGTLVPREFAFSIENFRPLEFVPLFALHDDDRDLHALSSLIRLLRGDEPFRRDIDELLDSVQEELGFCPRRHDGTLGSMREIRDPEILDTAAVAIGSALEDAGFAERAVATLQRSGHEAWVNCAGHVAVRPGAGPRP